MKDEVTSMTTPRTPQPRPRRSVDMTSPSSEAGTTTLPGAAPRKRTFLHALGERVAAMQVAPLMNYYLILIVVTILTILGLVMVMSSSMSWSIRDDSSAWAQASRQTILVAIGVFVMWVALRTKLATIRRFSGLLLAVSIVLLIAVLIPGIGTGLEETGSQSWIVLAGVRLQPSEVARVAIAVWGAAFLSERTRTPEERRRKLVIYGGVATIMTLLIFAERDFGMGVSFFMVAFVLWMFAGMNKWIMIATAGAAVLAFALLMALGGFRSARFTVYFDALFGHFEDTKGAAFQSYQGFLSLADGSLFGLGLGQSRAKWFYLPEAKNDFIFAVIGEELGLMGAAMVVALFCTLGVIGLRVARRSANQFLTLMSATLTTAIVLQAFINMGYVVGLFPVTGIQLPLISSGGTSAIITLGAMGLLANCARHEPEAMSHMASYGKPGVDQLLMLPEPSMDDIYVPSNTRRTGPVEGSRTRPREVPAQRAPRPSSAPVRVAAPRDRERASSYEGRRRAQRSNGSVGERRARGLDDRRPRR